MMYDYSTDYPHTTPNRRKWQMAMTISTHNGSKVAREHNIRNPKVVRKEQHIQQDGKFEIWKDEKPKDAYKRIFGQAVEDYNAKQKRADRKIKDYYSHICNDSKKHPVYEMIIAIGDRKNYKDGTIQEETAKSILREFVDGWQERNPNLELIGAYYHADEQGAPHAHLDYIPVATGYKRGLEVQSALVKALEQQGFTYGRETEQIQWQRRENAHLESLCLSRGIEITHPRIEGIKHLDTKIFKYRSEAIELHDELQDMELELQTCEHFMNIAIEEEKKAQEQTEQEQRNVEMLREQVSELENNKRTLKKELSDYQDILDKKLAWDFDKRFCTARVTARIFEHFVPIAEELHLFYNYAQLDDSSGRVVLCSPQSESELLATALAKAKRLAEQDNRGNSLSPKPRR